MKIKGWQYYDTTISDNAFHYITTIEHRIFHCYIYFGGWTTTKYLTRYRIYFRLTEEEWYSHFDFTIVPNLPITRKNIRDILNRSVKDLIVLRL